MRSPRSPRVLGTAEPRPPTLAHPCLAVLMWLPGLSVVARRGAGSCVKRPWPRKRTQSPPTCARSSLYGVLGGVEALPHAAREWRDTFATDPTRACLDFDESNAYNAVHRETFLRRTRAVFPGLAR